MMQGQPRRKPPPLGMMQGQPRRKPPPLWAHQVPEYRRTIEMQPPGAAWPQPEPEPELEG